MVDDADENFIDCEVLNIDEEENVLSVGENIGKEKKLILSMEMYIMKKIIHRDNI